MPQGILNAVHVHFKKRRLNELLQNFQRNNTATFLEIFR